MKPKKILILYTELAGYLIACLRELGAQGHQVTVLHWPVNPEAPFEIKDIPSVDFIQRTSADFEQVSDLIDSSQPDIILCSGWIDKGYIRALGFHKRKTPVVLLMDNQWTGGLKQRVLSTVGRLWLKKRFTHAWVAGDSQRTYALKMGFKSNEVQTGFYSADTALFEPIYADRLAQQKRFPRSFVYVGRYIEHKGIRDLWAAFLSAKQVKTSDWKLICVGTGEDYDDRVIHEDIEHLGFKQPEALREVIREAGVFVLPSHFEPWGVVVHEMAAAGLPMLLSSTVGAASQFLKEGENGYAFTPANREELQKLFLHIMSLSEAELKAMAVKSQAVSKSNSPSQWVDVLLRFL